MIGDTWQAGIQILEVGMGFIMEVGRSLDNVSTFCRALERVLRKQQALESFHLS